MPKNIAFIPARGGSKSIPKKNIKDLYNKPLIYWSLKACVDSKIFDEIILFTDSPEILSVAKSFEFSNKLSFPLRSKESSTDTSSTEDAMIEFINNSNLAPDDLFFLVQATGPFTKAIDFINSLKIINSNKADSLLSVCEFKRFIWSESEDNPLFIKPFNYNFHQRPRRQDFKSFYIENGAFYINRVSNILKDKCRLSGNVANYIMPEYTVLEIDEEDDWIQAQAIFKKYNFD